jgi:cobaltochelatase CobN
LATLMLCVAGMLAVCTAFPASAASALFIATSNVPPGKFQMLSGIAGQHGITIDVRYLDKLASADEAAQLIAGHDVVFVDSYLQDQVRARLGPALQGPRPLAWLYDKSPGSHNMPAALAGKLAVYYSNGGRENFDAFFATVAAWLSGSGYEGIPEPAVYPETAIYHPDAAGRRFTDPLAYLAWKGVDPGQHPPVIGLAFHEQYLSSLQTGLVDALIRSIEAHGGVPLAYYHPIHDETANLRMLAPGGKRLADAIITTRIMLEPNGPRAEYEKLGIPVIQATAYRRGNEAQWRADPQGIPLTDVPFYMSQAEYAGVTDIQVAAARDTDSGELLPVDAQLEAVVAKSMRLAALARKAPADKHVAIFFWNYPPGEKNLSASFLNLPRSLAGTLAAMRAAGYTVMPQQDARPGGLASSQDTGSDRAGAQAGADAEPLAEAALLPRLQRLLEPHYRQDRLADLVADGLADRLPVADYKAWLATLPASVAQEMNTRWGAPEASYMVLREGGREDFVIPRLMAGNIAVLPQPPRGEREANKEKAIYHSTTEPASHAYLATYLWARTQFGADAFVHYGTHGTQEWMPGKERGLSVHDYPMLALGDVPVVYPYIADNIGEALQARRRGRAVIVSHQTPPFRPAGMHDDLTLLHNLLHDWLNQTEGAVRENIKADILSRAAALHVDLDMGWTPERASREFPAFIDAMHAHLHELAQTAQPLGLHTLGSAPENRHRLATVMLMLGQPFWNAAATQEGVAREDLDETLALDYEKLDQAAPYRLLQRVLIDGQDTAGFPAGLKEQLAQARRWYDAIGAQGEQSALLAGLAGRYIPTSYGGDPIKNPEAYPTGRNLYGFDPSRVPSRQAWEAGKQAAEDLIAAHRAGHGGQAPSKVTFSLWSVETMRHQGLLEAQALWLMGVEPVWNQGGRVTDVKLVDRQTLGRPRVDVVLSATGLYRDHFPNAIKQLARAAQLAALADEPDNAVALNTRRIRDELVAQGVAADRALDSAQTRIFSSASGQYGTGLDDATLASDTWGGKEEGDAKLAALYLSKMQFAYGPDESRWGQRGAGGQDVNLYAQQLRGTEAAVLSRTSNTYGMLTTDDPFQYLGGIGLAVRSLDGKPPGLYISNLRGGGAGKVEGASGFLAKELATRQFHPGYIKGLMAEGYAGTLAVLDATNNLWGWTAVAREVVRDDQWETMADVYVRDKYGLGIDEWFEKENPHAQAQMIERMLEAARKGYWAAEQSTIDLLKQRYQSLAARYDVQTGNQRFLEYLASGQPDDFASASPEAAQAQAEPPAQSTPQAQAEQVEGMQLEKVEPASAAPDDPDMQLLFVMAFLLLVFMAGALRQTRRPGRGGIFNSLES